MFGRKKQKPQPTTPAIRETLFGDMPMDRWVGDGSGGFPWSAFAEAHAQIRAGNQEAAMSRWSEIVAQPNLEPRHYLQAWHFLRAHGHPAPPEVAKQVLGVVVEVAMPEGLDLLAAYKDHSARYYNFSGAAVIWDHPDSSLDSAIDQLLNAGAETVLRIGPWGEERPGPPPPEQARLSFLTPSGLHFGQASMTILSQDPLASGVLQFATMLMQALIAKTERK
jgi:hypothetical protein